MADLDMTEVTRYLLLGAGALYTPVLINKIPPVASLLTKVPYLQTDVFGVTIFAILFGGLGVLITENLLYK